MTQNLLAEIFALSSEVVEAAQTRGLTMGTAESCTGGLIGSAITATPGSSSVFLGGIIAYHNDVKISHLGVQREAIDDFGAVSESVAAQMANGCRERLSVDIAVSVTGIAGPGGGSAEKPVGTVWVGLATKQGVSATLHNFPGRSRNKVRDYTCLAALKTLQNALR